MTIQTADQNADYIAWYLKVGGDYSLDSNLFTRDDSSSAATMAFNGGHEQVQLQQPGGSDSQTRDYHNDQYLQENYDGKSTAAKFEQLTHDKLEEAGSRLAAEFGENIKIIHPTSNQAYIDPKTGKTKNMRPDFVVGFGGQGNENIVVDAKLYEVDSEQRLPKAQYEKLITDMNNSN
ncbi:unnamed protein product, partial [Didymodactylos carnosus]